MLDALLKYSLNNRIASFVFAVTLGVLGFFAFRDLTVEAFPDPTDTQVQVITLFDGERYEGIPGERHFRIVRFAENEAFFQAYAESIAEKPGDSQEIEALARTVVAGHAREELGVLTARTRREARQAGPQRAERRGV